MTDRSSFEHDLIADMRAHDGAVTTGPLKGHPLLIMMSKGAKSGQPRRAILTWSRDGDAYVVAGTAGGSPVAPSWLRNVEVNPDVTVEIANATFDATASVAAGSDRDELWNRHVAAVPTFAAYPEKTGRVIPMIRLTPKG